MSEGKKEKCLDCDRMPCICAYLDDWEDDKEWKVFFEEEKAREEIRCE